MRLGQSTSRSGLLWSCVWQTKRRGFLYVYVVKTQLRRRRRRQP